MRQKLYPACCSILVLKALYIAMWRACLVYCPIDANSDMYKLYNLYNQASGHGWTSARSPGWAGNKWKEWKPADRTVIEKCPLGGEVYMLQMQRIQMQR